MWLAPVLIGAIAAVWVLYYTDKSFSKAKKWTLALLRFFLLTLIGFLLLSPLLKVSERVAEKPLLIWLTDQSSSMISNADSLEVKRILAEEIGINQKELVEKYNLRKLNFSRNVFADERDALSGTETNISKAIQEAQQRFYNENVAAAVLLSDGIFNRGSNPVYEIENSPFPYYVIGFGDTNVRKDLFIENLVHNEITYLNNSFPLEINIRARQLNSEQSRVRVLDENNRVVFNNEFSIESDNYYQKFEIFLNPDSVGVRKYRVFVEAVEGEIQKNNNYRSFTIEVVDNRKKVLVLGSSPHPDMAAISSAISSFEKYELTTALEQDYNFEDTDVDLYILHQPGQSVLQQMQSSSKPFWIIYGQSVNPSSFNQLSGIRLGNRAFENIQTYSNSSFNLFSLNEDLSDFVLKLPPLQSPFGKVNISRTFQPLLLKRIRRVESGEYLWFFGNKDNRRSAYTMGTGIWQWRMFNYRMESNFELFDELIAQSVQYLTTKPEDQRFIVESENEYDKNTDVVFNARLYNLSLELNNEPDVELKIRSEEGDEYDFTFGRSSYAYRLNAGSLGAGNYSWTAKTSLGDENFERSGAFRVISSELEQTDLLARHDLLRQISQSSEGKFYKSDQLNLLTADLLNNDSAKSIQRLETNISSLLNKKWIFFILLLLLASEWGLRRYFGKY